MHVLSVFLCSLMCGCDDARLVYDRETGKPKGYGFCEYQDLETAQSAMRNLNNHDFNGRPLRVGVAAGEQTKDENRAMQQALGGPAAEVMLHMACISSLKCIISLCTFLRQPSVKIIAKHWLVSPLH